MIWIHPRTLDHSADDSSDDDGGDDADVYYCHGPEPGDQWAPVCAILIGHRGLLTVNQLF